MRLPPPRPLRAVSRLRVRKTGVTKPAGSRRLEHYQHCPSFLDPYLKTERPVVCGVLADGHQGPNPFGSAILHYLQGGTVSRVDVPLAPVPAPSPDGAGAFSARSVGATCPAWARVTAGASPAALTNFAAVAEHTRHPSSKRNDAGGSPAGSATARWCQSRTTVC